MTAFFTNHVGQLEVCPGVSACLPLPDQIYENASFFAPDSGTTYVPSGGQECFAGVWERFFISPGAQVSITSVTDVCSPAVDTEIWVRGGVENFVSGGGVSQLVIGLSDQSGAIASASFNIPWDDTNVQSWLAGLTLPAGHPQGKITITVSVVGPGATYANLLIYDYFCVVMP